MKNDDTPISEYRIRENATIVIIGSDSPITPQPQQTQPHPQPRTRTHREPKTEENTIIQIRSEVDSVRKTLLPSIDTFLDTLTAPLSVPAPVFIPTSTSTSSFAPKNQIQTPTPLHTPQRALSLTQEETPSRTRTPQPPSSTQEHTRLSELLLQSLLRLDAIHTDGSWELARAERKGAVRVVQGLLDSLDGGWAKRRIVAESGGVLDETHEKKAD